MLLSRLAPLVRTMVGSEAILPYASRNAICPEATMEGRVAHFSPTVFCLHAGHVPYLGRSQLFPLSQQRMFSTTSICRNAQPGANVPSEPTSPHPNPQQETSSEQSLYQKAKNHSHAIAITLGALSFFGYTYRNEIKTWRIFTRETSTGNNSNINYTERGNIYQGLPPSGGTSVEEKKK